MSDRKRKPPTYNEWEDHAEMLVVAVFAVIWTVVVIFGLIVDALR